MIGDYGDYNNPYASDRQAPPCPFKPGQTYRTRDGREARVYATDANQDWPIHGAIKKDVGWLPETWTAAGANTTAATHPDDLMPPTRAVTQWLNIYRHAGEVRKSFCASERAAQEEAALSRRNDCVMLLTAHPITWEEPV